MPGDHKAADKGHRSIDELLDATVKAKTYGVNARELLLQAARQIAQETDGNKSEEAESSKALLTQLFRRGPELLQALPKQERPLVPYKAIQRSKVPRINRQAVLERLTGQHLALALHKAGKAVSPSGLAQASELTQQALDTAVAQEEELYARGKASKAVYLNYAARTNAGLWEEADAAEEAGAAEGSIPSAEVQTCSRDLDLPESIHSADEQQHPESRKDDEQGNQYEHRKRRRLIAEEPLLLVEADIDWDTPRAETSPQSTGEDVHADAQMDDSKLPDPAVGVLEQRLQSPEEWPSKVAQSSTIAQPLLSLDTLRPLRPQTTSEDVSEDVNAPVTAPTGRHRNASEERLQDMKCSTAVYVSASEGLEEYSPSRHGGESPPQGPLPRNAATAGRSQKDEDITAADGATEVAKSVGKFLRSHLDPLFQAKVISRAVYKAAMQKTMDKVMRSHPDAVDARFLIREGDKIRKLLTQYVDYISGQQDS